MNRPLLSICIPTYNRCDILDKTLSALINNPEYNDDLIEIIVSDNCSTDNTIEIAKKYKTVKYYRNSENVRDLNFLIILDYAEGHYLKLFNDTLSFKAGELKFMLETLKDNLDKKVNVFFYQNIFIQKNCLKEIHSAKQLLQTVSYSTTWIINFGVWKEDYEKIKEKDRYTLLHFVQVDWTYKLVNNGKQTNIYFRDLFEIAVTHNKGVYNVFDVFINNYLFIIKQERLPWIMFKIEKYRLFRYFVFPWFITLMINEKAKYSFSVKGVYQIIFRKYWYEFYLYLFLLLVLIEKLKKWIKT